MWKQRILITGGAGFIGSHLSKTLVQRGWAVTVLDNLSPQVHGSEPSPDLPDEVDLIVGDVRNSNDVARAIKDQDVIVHLAAETGTGQSMYEATRYEQVNVYGTTVLMEEIARQAPHSIRKIVVASSRAIYGEGAHWCADHGIVYPKGRKHEDMCLGLFENRCPVCQDFCLSIPTSEDCPFSPSSFYGITKQVQEQTVLLLGKTLGIPATALRFQNVYGPGQSLQNPYTGILAVFTNLAREGKPIQVFEDGKESRDFVYIEDVVDATCLCIDRHDDEFDSFNVGSGEIVTVADVARAVVNECRSDSKIEISGAFRAGDIRHNLANLSYSSRKLGYRPRWKFADGLKVFVDWALGRESTESLFEASMNELKSRGLLMGISLK